MDDLCFYPPSVQDDIIQVYFFFFFFNDTATTEIYTLSLHDALPICTGSAASSAETFAPRSPPRGHSAPYALRSEEHTSELQSQSNLVCRLLLEKKKKKTMHHISDIPYINDSINDRDSRRAR